MTRIPQDMNNTECTHGIRARKAVGISRFLAIIARPSRGCNRQRQYSRKPISLTLVQEFRLKMSKEKDGDIDHIFGSLR